MIRTIILKLRSVLSPSFFLLNRPIRIHDPQHRRRTIRTFRIHSTIPAIRIINTIPLISWKSLLQGLRVALGKQLLLLGLF